MIACNCDSAHLCPLGCLADHENDYELGEFTVTEEQKNALDELVQVAEEDGLYDRPGVDELPAETRCICTYVEIGRRLTQQVLNPGCQAHGPEDPPLVEKDRDFL